MDLMSKLSMDDLLVMARTVYGEARGEGYLGQIGVAWVILNRAEDPGKDWWGDSIRDVCLKPQQFSCWNRNDVNREKLLSVGPSDRAFLSCLMACCDVLSGRTADPTHGADHYCRLDVSPAWAQGQVPIAQLRNHVFFKLGSGA